MLKSRSTLIPRYGLWVMRFRGQAVDAFHGLCQGTVPCSSKAMICPVMRSYALALMSLSFRSGFAVEDFNFGVGTNPHHGGRRLEPDRLVEPGGELADRLVHENDRRAVIHPDHTAQPVLIADRSEE